MDDKKPKPKVDVGKIALRIYWTIIVAPFALLFLGFCIYAISNIYQQYRYRQSDAYVQDKIESLRMEMRFYNATLEEYRYLTLSQERQAGINNNQRMSIVRMHELYEDIPAGLRWKVPADITRFMEIYTPK